MAEQKLGGMVHGLIGWPIYAAATIVLGAGLLLGIVGRGRPSLMQLGALRLVWGHWLWWVQPFWSRTIEGLDNLPAQAAVLASNHRSVIDIPALYGLPAPLRTCARPGIFRVPVMGPFLSLSGQVPSDRLLEEGVAALRAGHHVLVFAEGSRSPDGEVKRFKTGAFRLAREADVPVVPIAIVGGEKIMAKGQAFPTRWFTPVRVRILPPVRPLDGEDDRAFASRVRDLVAAEVLQLDPEGTPAPARVTTEVAS